MECEKTELDIFMEFYNDERKDFNIKEQKRLERFTNALNEFLGREGYQLEE